MGAWDQIGSSTVGSAIGAGIGALVALLVMRRTLDAQEALTRVQLVEQRKQLADAAAAERLALRRDEARALVFEILGHVHQYILEYVEARSWPTESLTGDALIKFKSRFMRLQMERMQIVTRARAVIGTDGLSLVDAIEETAFAGWSAIFILAPSNAPHSSKVLVETAKMAADSALLVFKWFDAPGPSGRQAVLRELKELRRVVKARAESSENGET